MTELIYIPGSFLALFLSLLIASKKNKKSYDYVLLVWLLLISTHITVLYLNGSGYPIHSRWILLNAAFPLLQVVFLYLYTGLMLQKIKIQWAIVAHLTPFFIFAILIFILGEVVLNSLIIGVTIFGVTYIVITFNMLGSFPDFFKRDNHWLKILTSGLGAIWLIFILIGILNHLFGFGQIDHRYIFLSINIFVLAIGYFGLREGLILQEPRSKGRYTSSPLTDADFGIIGYNLNKLRSQESFYLDPDLKINGLASKIDVPAHHLSQYFSSHLGETYYEYINQLRIEELKKKIGEGKLDTLSILGLAYDCGFNSKATFNRAFKKQTGQTPSEYIKSLK